MNMIEMCMCGTIMIILVLLLRRILGNRIPRLFFVLFWWAVLVRLLVPFHLSLPHTPPAHVTNLVEDTYDKADAWLGQVHYTAVPDDIKTNEPETSLQKEIPLKSIWIVFWIIGSCSAACFIIILYIKSIRLFREALPIDSNLEKKWIEKYPLHRHVHIKTFDRISSPLTYGVFRPIILLPSGMSLRDANLDQVLRHEYEHIRHFDALTKNLMLVAACLYWFDPFVWIMVHFFNKDIELFTDEQVIQGMTEKDRWKYARTLTVFADKQQKNLLWGQGFGKNSVLERIGAIFSFRKKRKISLIAGILFLMILLVTFFLRGDSWNQKMLRNVQKYNESIQRVSYHDPWIDFTYSENKTYENLCRNTDGIIGSISIPAIDMEADIYQGTDQRNMRNGVMHMSGSFLPGKNGTNVILTGHNGLDEKMMFTDLNKIETGSSIVINMYGKSWEYIVTGAETVLPEEYAPDVKDSENILTLITPVPFGINTHRLIVSARLEN